MRFSRNICLLVLLVLSIATVYGNTLDGPFLFDDIPNIVQNGFLKIDSLNWDTLKWVWEGKHPSRLRKIPNLTFALNYLSCGFSPYCYHLTNIAIHCISTLLAWWFFFQLLGVGWLKEKFGQNRLWISWFGAMIWGLHPLQINAVTYIVQRMTSMAGLFGLFSLNCMLRARRHFLEAPSNKVKFILWLILSALGWFLGLLCKENLLILPFLALGTEAFLFRRGEFRLPARAIGVAGLGILLVMIFYMPMERIGVVFSGYERRDFNALERLLTQSRVLWHYLSLFVFPASERFALLYEYPISRGLISPATTLPSVISWIFLSIVLWRKRASHPILCWVFFWYLAAHSMESSIIPLELIFEHRNYLPSLSLAFGTILSIILFFQYFSKKFSASILLNDPRTQVLLGLGLLFILGTGTYVRNMDYADSITFYRAELEKFPKSKRLRLNLALELNKQGKFGEGGARLKKLVEEYPDDITYLQNWLNFLVRVAGEYEKATDIYGRISRIIEEGRYDHHKDSRALKNLAVYFMDTQEYEKAIYLLDVLLKDYPMYESLWFKKGVCHARMEEWGKAEESFSEGHRLNPGDFPLMYWLGKSLIKMGKKSEGCALVKRAGEDPVREDALQTSQELFQLECLSIGSLEEPEP